MNCAVYYWQQFAIFCVIGINLLLQCSGLLLFIVDKGKQKAAETNGEAPSGGKDVATPTTAPQSRVKVEPPVVEDILRYPIEVFVSSGEAFIHPESTYYCHFTHQYYNTCLWKRLQGEPKKLAPFLYTLTLPNIDRFQNYFTDFQKYFTVRIR